jgi:hypothetical protein
MARGRPLFDEMVSLTGVSPMFAAGLVTRALADAGVTIDGASAHDYEEALPRLRARLKAYLPEDRAEERAQAIRARIAELKGTPARPTPAGLVRYRVKAQIADRVREGGEAPRPEVAAPPSTALEWDDPEDFTTVGRRWTADELAAARARPDDKKK